MGSEGQEIPPEAIAIREARTERFLKHLPESDDLALIALKGHLLAEETLADIARSYCASPEMLDDDRLSFSAKLLFARAVAPKSTPDYAWRGASLLNSLRNVVAHRLESPEVQKRLNQLLSHVQKQSSSSIFDRAQETDAECLKSAIAWILIVLAAVEARTKQYRAAGQ